MNLFTKQIHRLRRCMVTSRGRVWEGTVREFGMYIYTLLYLKWITKKHLLYSTGKSAQFYVAIWIGGEFRGEGTHVYL